MNTKMLAVAMPATETKTFRHTAETQYGTFRADFRGRQYPHAVVYCGWHALPEATKRRMEAKEGICYGWARDLDQAMAMSDRAVEEGCTNVVIADVAVRELP